MFNLVRYFSLLSFGLIAVVASLLTFYYRSITLDQLLRHEQNRAEDFTRVFENSLWPHFRSVIDAATASTPTSSTSNAQFRADIARMMNGTDVIKIKLYSLQGLTVFSTDPSQMGESKASNAGFLSARQGTPISELTHRNQFDAFEGVLQDRDVISTYVPIYAKQQGKDRVEGVFEVYLDVTGFVQTADERLKWVSIIVLAVLAALYLAQLMVVRRAQSILRVQALALQDANRELDQRVNERTRELQAEITERRHAEHRLDHLAHHDPLTNLPNRLLFRLRLTQSLDDLPRKDHQLAVLIIGLDHFKEVNETLGHVIGDELLVVIALRLQACLQPTDLLARMGGDEFSCILQGIHTPVDAATRADALVELFKRPFIVGENLLYLSASIGISLAPQDDHEVAKLVRNANAAMYQAKARGRNRSHFYTPEITTSAQDRLRLAGLLRKAISADELMVHFQPKVNPENGQLCGAEALVRWTQLEMGPVPLARFIPLAEEIGFIIELGTWVLRETCLQIMAWDAAGLRVPRVSVNVSVKQLERGNLVQTLSAILAETGLDPHRLELEITESVIMAVDDAITVLLELRALGVQLSIDDFGTGYSSLSYLKKLPIQTLKIDRAFVMGIGKNKSDESIIQAILEISKSLGLHTVAEGVETEEQLDFLRQRGCHQIQGFFYGEAIEQHDFFTRWEPHQARQTLSNKHLQAV